MQLKEATVKLADDLDLVPRRLLDTQLCCDFPQQPFRGDLGVQDYQKSRLIGLIGKTVKDLSGKGRLARADIADNNGQPLHGLGDVHDPGQRLGMLSTVVVKTLVGCVTERFRLKAVKIKITHSDSPYIKVGNDVSLGNSLVFTGTTPGPFSVSVEAHHPYRETSPWRPLLPSPPLLL